jgi:hypothetical protein
LEGALVHQHAPAVDRQGDDREQGYGAHAKDDEHLAALTAETSQADHQYSTAMADVDTM